MSFILHLIVFSFRSFRKIFIADFFFLTYLIFCWFFYNLRKISIFSILDIDLFCNKVVVFDFIFCWNFKLFILFVNFLVNNRSFRVWILGFVIKFILLLLYFAINLTFSSSCFSTCFIILSRSVIWWSWRYLASA